MISIKSTGESVPTLMEAALLKGMDVGIVTTADVTDATPASFLAHAVDR